MALVLKPARISEKVVECIKKDVQAKVFPNDNRAINEILKLYYKIPSEFEISKPTQKTKK